METAVFEKAHQNVLVRLGSDKPIDLWVSRFFVAVFGIIVVGVRSIGPQQ